jgi:group I intron endonuclease
MYIVYQITNKNTGKRYIGQTSKTIEKRWYKHVMEARSGTRFYFYDSIRKHGENSFEIKKIDTAPDRDTADYLETFWITALQTYNPKYGYNGTMGGDGVIRTSEINAKISKALMGHPVSQEQRDKQSARLRGRKQSPEFIAKRFAARKPLSTEKRQALSERMKKNQYAKGHYNPVIIQNLEKARLIRLAKVAAKELFFL